MPNSEQEMRERARKWWDGVPKCLGYPACDGDLVAIEHSEVCPLYQKPEPTFLDRLCDFALLERAEARRETIEECAQIADERKTKNLKFAYGFDKSNWQTMADRAIAAADECKSIAASIRAKLTPAPEAEKEQQ